MKTIFLSIAILISYSSFSSSTTTREGNYKDGYFTISLNSTSESKVKVNIYDNKKNFIFSDKVKANEIDMKNYNLSQLPSGNYIVELIFEGETSTYTISHERVEESRKDGTARVEQVVDTNLYKLNLSDFSASTVWFYILDKSSTVLYKEEISVNNNFTKTYNLSQLKSSDFSFVVRTKDSTITPTKTVVNIERELITSK